jgi:Na+-transporting NADH:ubiquinone oxidoreductase subunit NqrC
MEFVSLVWTWLTANWAEVIAILFAIEVVAVQIVNLTPTNVDNKVLDKLHSILVFVANIVPNTKTTLR